MATAWKPDLRSQFDSPVPTGVRHYGAPTEEFSSRDSLYVGILNNEGREDWGPHYRRVVCPRPLFKVKAGQLVLTFDVPLEFTVEVYRTTKVGALFLALDPTGTFCINAWDGDLATIPPGRHPLIFLPERFSITLACNPWTQAFKIHE